MRLGGSFLLIAVGAILKFAVTTTVSGVDLATVGVILMVVGVAGLIITLVLMTMRKRTDVTYRPEGPGYGNPPPGRTTYRESQDPNQF